MKITPEQVQALNRAATGRNNSTFTWQQATKFAASLNELLQKQEAANGK